MAGVKGATSHQSVYPVAPRQLPYKLVAPVLVLKVTAVPQG
jgi:hypothetical protein